ncbi:porin [Lampropedia puyangensis]|uniref:Porin n=1 Tax=Lampropedia puyangensis TaxID=1330072 RepID=A0A4S8FE13_9BURK|nr:porin [Lampropedia puyangensis]THU05331.1 porin [Lampropedia puyangensis]
MKKHLPFVLVPLLAAGAVAHAQSSVTLYGRVNTTLENQKYSGQSSTTGLQSNSSFIGFRGSEDLGGGLKAGFVLEQQLDSTTGASSGFQRETHVSLSGGFGTLKAGNYNSTAYTYTADYISMHNHDTGSSADALFAYVVPNAAKVGYISPTFGGFSFELGYGFEDNHGGDNSPFDLSASYKVGNFDLGAAYSQFDKAKATTLRALYTGGNFALGGYVQYDDNGFNPAATTSHLGYTDFGDRLSARLVGAYFLGASEFHANVGWADEYDKIDKSGAMQYTLGYNYNLSKRTKVYGFYTRVDNERNATYAGASAGQDFSSFAVGLRHLF